MSETQSTSGAPEAQPSGQPEPQANEQKNVVSYESHAKLLNEKKVLAQKLKEIEENRLREQNDLKGLLEMREKELGEHRSLLESFKAKEAQSAKAKAFKSMLKSNIDEKWLKNVPWENIKYDDTSGTVDPRSVEIEAAKFRQEWPEAFGIVPNGATATSPAAKPLPGSPSVEEWAKLPLAEKKKLLAEQVQKYSAGG